MEEVWSVFLYGVEGWTLKKSDRNRIDAFEMWCWRRLLGVSLREHKTNEAILEEVGQQRELMAKVAKLKLQYFGHVVRGSAGDLALKVLEGNIMGKRYRGAPKKQWVDNIKEWTGLSYIQCKRMSQDRTLWRARTKAWSSSVANPQRRTAA